MGCPDITSLVYLRDDLSLTHHAVPCFVRPQRPSVDLSFPVAWGPATREPTGFGQFTKGGEEGEGGVYSSEGLWFVRCPFRPRMIRRMLLPKHGETWLAAMVRRFGLPIDPLCVCILAWKESSGLSLVPPL